MSQPTSSSTRRSFLKQSAILGAGLISAPAFSMASAPTAIKAEDENNMYLVGPIEGYSPQIGTLLSTMNMMRFWVIDTFKDLTVEQLDFQIDDKSNSIGAMLMHLAATERYYQLNTFEGYEWGTWDDSISAEWDIASGLGEKARKEIVGHSADYYIEQLEAVRNHTKEEFAKRDDAWLMESEPFFGNLPTNNHCKWFHVCEHESNHRGQMKFIKKRFPA